MAEPYYFLTSIPIPEPYYSEIAPVEFKQPDKKLYMVPLTEAIKTSVRDFFTRDELAEDKTILKMTANNTMKNHLRINTDNDFISIRSAKTQIPCAVSFMMPNKKAVFKVLNIDNILDYYIIFITSDEIMLAEKDKFKPTQIKKTITNIKNKMATLCPTDTPILATEIFVYDAEADRYVEI